MPAQRKPTPASQTTRPRRPPATTPEMRETQMVSLAVDLAEQQLIDGSASAQVITHYLKLGTTREALEQEKLRHENELLQARRQALDQQGDLIELYGNALKAMTAYQGRDEVPEGVEVFDGEG